MGGGASTPPPDRARVKMEAPLSGGPHESLGPQWYFQSFTHGHLKLNIILNTFEDGRSDDVLPHD